MLKKHMYDFKTNPLLRDSNKLLYFFLAVHKGSIRGAAKHIGISQPSFSRALRDFEGRVGTKLMLRSQNGIQLTKAGKELFSFASDFVKAAAENYAKLTGKEKNATVRFGTHEILFSPVLELLMNSGDLELVETSPSVSDLATKVISGVIDVALAVEGAKLNNSKLLIDRVIKDHFAIFYCASKLKQREATQLPIAYSPDCLTSPTKTLSEVLNELAFPTNGSIKLSLEAVKTIVLRGAAVGILPSFCMRHELASGEVKVLSSKYAVGLRTKTRHQLCLITRAEEGHLPIYKQFSERLRRLG